VDEVWGPYSETILHFPEASLSIDLREPVPPDSCRTLAGIGLPGPFAVVTACNPLGRILEPRANQRLSAVLAGVVLAQHPGAVRADGGAPAGGHLEPGWALATSLERAGSLAARFFQNAVFWFEDGRFSIVPVLVRGPVLALPRAPAARSPIHPQTGTP
jgi:hypothetical protein